MISSHIAAETYTKLNQTFDFITINKMLYCIPRAKQYVTEQTYPILYL